MCPVLTLLAFVFGQPEPAPASQPTVSSTRPITLAVLDFAVDAPNGNEIGQQIAEVITISLSGGQFEIVDRSTLAETLKEQELTLTGLVNTDHAVKAGRLVGAEIIVVGKAFTMGKNLFLTAKIIGTETSRLDGDMIKGDAGADLAELAVQLSERLAQRLPQSATMVLENRAPVQDPLIPLKASLKRRKLPVVCVLIPEQHLNQVPAPDPAAETELRLMLKECGFAIRTIAPGSTSRIYKELTSSKFKSWPSTLEGVDVVIVGEAISEFGVRIGRLVSCSARMELQVIDRGNAEILHVERTTQRGIDLSENIAAKNALQSAGRICGLGVLSFFARTAPANAPASQPAKPNSD